MKVKVNVLAVANSDNGVESFMKVREQSNKLSNTFIVLENGTIKALFDSLGKVMDAEQDESLAYEFIMLDNGTPTMCKVRIKVKMLNGDIDDSFIHVGWIDITVDSAMLYVAEPQHDRIIVTDDNFYGAAMDVLTHLPAEIDFSAVTLNKLNSIGFRVEWYNKRMMLCTNDRHYGFEIRREYAMQELAS